MKIKRDRAIYYLFGLTLVTIVIWQFPFGMFVLYPFTILGTWFHEMGHGLTAMCLGGYFQRLEIFSNGSGLAVHSGNLYFGNLGGAIVAAAGPMGPTLAGSLFILASKKNKTSRILLFIFSILLIISIVLWLRSLFGIGVIFIFAMLISFIAIRKPSKIQNHTLQFLGVQAFASTYLSIDYIFSAGGTIEGKTYLSDTAVISQYLFFPYWFWGGIIAIFSLIVIIFTIRKYFK